MTKQTIKDIKKCYKKGRTVEQIAEAFNITEAQVINTIKK